MNLAILWGAQRVVLVGFDMGPLAGKDHFFGEHPKTLRNSSPYATFRKAFEQVAHDCRTIGVQVQNASPRSHLTAFPRVTLKEALTWLAAS